MKINPKIFREYDIRGTYQTDFDEDFAVSLGYYYAHYLLNTHSLSLIGSKNQDPPKVKISVGFDARLSSPSLAQAICSGIRKAGCDVVSLGLISSPLSYYSCFTIENLSGAIIVTGSHNPPDQNGFKISKAQTTIHGLEILKLKEIILHASKDLSILQESGSLEDFDIIPKYVERYTSEFKNKLGKLTAAFDCANGTAGVVISKMFDSLNLKGQILYAEPDGRFPNHHPDPTIESHLKDLSQCVVSNKYDVGFSYDGDADRIGVVDDLGRMVCVDQFMILYAQQILKEFPGAPIIGDVKCSQVYYEKIKSLGGIPIMWKTGHSLIKDKIRDEKAPFGGELSGHVFFADRNYGFDDAFYASLRLLEALQKEDIKLSKFINDLPQLHSTPELRIDVPEEDKFNIVEDLKKKIEVDKKVGSHKFVSLNSIDGIRVLFETGWVLVRASNTQAAITVRFENSNLSTLEQLKSEFSKLLNLNL